MCHFKIIADERAYFYHILFGFLDGILDVKVSVIMSNNVINTDGMTLNKQPVVDHSLYVGEEEPGDIMAHLQVGDVDQRASWCSKRLLTQDAHDQRPILHYDLFENIFMCIVSV